MWTKFLSNHPLGFDLLSGSGLGCLCLLLMGLAAPVAAPVIRQCHSFRNKRAMGTLRLWCWTSCSLTFSQLLPGLFLGNETTWEDLLYWPGQTPSLLPRLRQFFCCILEKDIPNSGNIPEDKEGNPKDLWEIRDVSWHILVKNNRGCQFMTTQRKWLTIHFFLKDFDRMW